MDAFSFSSFQITFDVQSSRRARISEFVAGLTGVFAVVGDQNFVDLEISRVENLVSTTGQFSASRDRVGVGFDPFDGGLRCSENPALENGCRAYDGLRHLLGRLDDGRRQGENVEIEVFESITERIRSVALEHRGVFLLKTFNGEEISLKLTPRAGWSLLDGHAIDEPLQFGFRHPGGIALKGYGFFLGRVFLLRGFDPVWGGLYFDVHRMRFRWADTVAGRTFVDPFVFKIRAFDDQSFTVVSCLNSVAVLQARGVSLLPSNLR